MLIMILYLKTMRTLLLLFALCPLLATAEADTMISHRATDDFALTADPSARYWAEVDPVVATNDAMGRPTPGHRTEIRSRWTDDYLYFLFTCPYEQLHLKPNPKTDEETPELWNWDVAEVFIGADFSTIEHYYEFQVSPQGEYIDLDIHSDNLNWPRDMKWDSGYEVKARIDRDAKIWYGEMKIPIARIDSRPPRPGNEFRANFYRLQGPGPDRRQIVWQPTHSRTHHVPKSFGRLVLGE